MICWTFAIVICAPFVVWIVSRLWWTAYFQTMDDHYLKGDVDEHERR